MHTLTNKTKGKGSKVKGKESLTSRNLTLRRLFSPGDGVSSSTKMSSILVRKIYLCQVT